MGTCGNTRLVAFKPRDRNRQLRAFIFPKERLSHEWRGGEGGGGGAAVGRGDEGERVDSFLRFPPCWRRSNATSGDDVCQFQSFTPPPAAPPPPRRDDCSRAGDARRHDASTKTRSRARRIRCFATDGRDLITFQRLVKAVISWIGTNRWRIIGEFGRLTGLVVSFWIERMERMIMYSTHAQSRKDERPAGC